MIFPAAIKDIRSVKILINVIFLAAIEESRLIMYCISTTILGDLVFTI